MLNPSDVYVSGGSNNLLACWTDKVTKYDASSFYNWEQDNLPLHDLDERTHLLWEKFGHPTSALTGMSFIVSADATDTCNPLFFTTLSACINALPEVINCPILVEVASFGNLGGLNLSNKAFGPNGALEIINRNSAVQGGISNQDSTMFGANRPDTILNNSLASSVVPGANSVNAPGFYLAAGGALVGSATPALSLDSMRARLFTRNTDGSEILISSSTGSEYADSRFVNPYVFSKRSTNGDGSDTTYSRLTAALSSTLTPWETSPSIARDLSSFSFQALERNSTTEMNTYDVSTLDFISGDEIVWGNTEDNVSKISLATAAVCYFNSLDYIKVKNCDGPIYLRNFNVDAQHTRDNAIEISNSKVVLERSAASRANKAGLFADNSEVIITRGFVGYRNYELVGGERTGTPFAEKREAYQTQETYGAGIYALNSTINLSSTYDRDTSEALKLITTEASGIYSDYYGSLGTLFSSVHLPSVVNESIFCLSRNDIGIHCVNSNLIGGNSELQVVSGVQADGATRRLGASFLTCELNTEAGIKADNSFMEYRGLVFLDGNYMGMDATNSTVETNMINARFNQSTGFKLNNSKFVYNKDLFASQRIDTPTRFIENENTAQVGGFRNGQDIVCNNSEITPTYTSSMPSLFGSFFMSGSFGLEDQTGKLLPSIELSNNSKADLIHARLIKEPAAQTRTSHYGLLARVEDNSTLTMRGSNEYANMIVGPASRADSVNVAGLYANNGSTIKMQGPTSVFRLGIDALAEDNSNIEITPHQNSNGELLVSSFDLSNPLNHTMVELHSTRACLVADRNSNILMENLGHYYDKWLTSPYASAALITPGYKFSDSVYANYVSAGYMQFYPNGNTNLLDADVAAANNKAVTGTGAYQFGSPGAGVMAADFIYNASPSVSSVTTGGMCVRAVGGSNVKAFNVHFPHNAFENTSSVIYDYEGQDPLPGPHCSRLFIWNIADNSFLDAAYLSISGTHPRDAGFYGPSGQWGDLSGAPSSTPDTSSLSILDYYGQSNDNPFGKSASGENFGCFRLYFSTDPATDFLVASGSNSLQGLARQLFAQGYNFSGNMIASATTEFDPSAQFISVLQRDENNNIEPSGFYYASAMMAGSDSIKAYLDDSALNSFANAKHNTVGKSGLAKVVQGYYDIESPGGDSYSLYPYGNGLGSINNFDLKKDD